MLIRWISVLLHGYVGFRLLPAMSWSFGAASLLVSLLMSVWAMPMGIGLRTIIANSTSTRGRTARPALVWLGWLMMGLFSSLLVLTVLRDTLLLLWEAIDSLGPLVPHVGWEQTHMAWSRWSALATWVLALAITAFGFLGARRTATVVEVTVPILNLPLPLQGFRIVQISDVHVGPTIRADYVQRIVGAVNGLRADMVAITGDLVDGSVSALREQVAPLAQLQSRHGSFFVTGNHEYYSGATEWVAELRRLGMHVLMNQHQLLAHDAAEVVVAGVTDFGAVHFDPAQRSDPQKAINDAPASAGVRILLAHQPRSAAAAAAAGFDLQLSGHTHGGQFLPWNFFVRLQQPFVAGLHRLQQLWIYTSRGTGYWGPPKRFGAPSEITLLRLVAA